MTTTAGSLPLTRRADWAPGSAQGRWTYEGYAALPDVGAHAHVARVRIVAPVGVGSRSVVTFYSGKSATKRTQGAIPPTAPSSRSFAVHSSMVSNWANTTEGQS